MKCPKCEAKNLKVVRSGPHKKLICADCLAFVKFLGEAEYKNFTALKKKEI